ncbi:MAG: lactate racemase domain-containing protein, partial [Desulfatiglandaceae bacterium]
MTDIAIPCGYEMVRLTLPTEVDVLESRPVPALADPTGAVAAALKDPIGCPPLQQLARDRKSACVVISDNTRPVPNRVILPPLLETLESAGIERDKITILVATGTHRANLGEELLALVGDQIAATYKIVN